MSSRRPRIILLFLVGILSPGCTTWLWAPNYEELKVVGFYVNSETSELLVATDDSAFVFSIDRDFSQVLLKSREMMFIPVFQDFHMDVENRITGKLQLSYSSSEDGRDESEMLKELGFESVNGSLMRFTRTMSGKKYMVEGDLPLLHLEEPLSVIMKRPRGVVGTAGRMVATPAAIYYDAVVTVPAVFILVLIMSTDSL